MYLDNSSNNDFCLRFIAKNNIERDLIIYIFNCY